MAALGQGTPHAGLRGRDLLDGLMCEWVRMVGGPHNFNVQIGRLWLLQIGRGGGVLPCIPLWQGSGTLEFLNFGLQK